MKNLFGPVIFGYFILILISCNGGNGEQESSIKTQGRSHLIGRWKISSYSVTEDIFGSGTHEFQFQDHGVIYANNDEIPELAKYKMGGWNLSNHHDKLKISFILNKPIIVEIQAEDADNFSGLLYYGNEREGNNRDAIGNIGFKRVKGKAAISSDFLYD